MKRIWIGFVLSVCIACSIYGDRQPGFSGEPFVIPQFSKDTAFPYAASAERKQSILDNYQKIQNGMNGDEVFSIMDRPDEVDRLAFVGGPTHGWAWDYFLNKQFERAPDEYDNHIAVVFDKSGLVTKCVVKLEAQPRPSPMPSNARIKIANAIN